MRELQMRLRVPNRLLKMKNFRSGTTLGFGPWSKASACATTWESASQARHVVSLANTQFPKPMAKHVVVLNGFHKATRHKEAPH